MKTYSETQFGLLGDEEMDTLTQPMPLHEMPVERRLPEALKVIERDYKRIHDVIQSSWGHREFGDFIRQLIMSGGDGMGQSRVGFKREVVTAMFVLSDLHDAQFA